MPKANSRGGARQPPESRSVSLGKRGTGKQLGEELGEARDQEADRTTDSKPKRAKDSPGKSNLKVPLMNSSATNIDLYSSSLLESGYQDLRNGKNLSDLVERENVQHGHLQRYLSRLTDGNAARAKRRTDNEKGR